VQSLLRPGLTKNETAMRTMANLQKCGMKAKAAAVPLALAVILCSAATLAAQTTTEEQQPEFVKQAQHLMKDGKPSAALDVYRQTLQTSPNSIPANIGAGNVLDLMGQGSEARRYFAKAIEVADTPESKVAAKRAMAMSYAFEGNCNKTVEYERQVFDFYGSKKDFFRQGEVADETGRVCLDSGALDIAEGWYAIGHNAVLAEPSLTSEQRDLWNFRWQHALARIAVRRGQQAEAQKHVAAAKAILDKGTIPDQVQFFPYLKGYVAFYSGDYKMALEELKQANQNDPFIQCLLGQTYEKLGDKGKATECYRKALAATFHSASAAYAVPFARKKLS
jgi:tetratricopeptide (TPR) repeat protein